MLLKKKIIPPPSFTAVHVHGRTCVHWAIGVEKVCGQAVALNNVSGNLVLGSSHGWLCAEHEYEVGRKG